MQFSPRLVEKRGRGERQGGGGGEKLGRVAVAPRWISLLAPLELGWLVWTAAGLECSRSCSAGLPVSLAGLPVCWSAGLLVCWPAALLDWPVREARDSFCSPTQTVVVVMAVVVMAVVMMAVMTLYRS